MLRFVINLDRALNRWNAIRKQLDALNISAQRISAVDAKTETLPLDKIARLGHPSKYFFPRELTKGEIGCYLSHILCWKALLESDDDWAAILEDDALLSPRAKFLLSSPNWIPPNIHILQLHTYEKLWRCKTMPQYISLSDGSKIHNVIEPSFGTCCYLIDREAAKEALALSNLIASPIDEFLFNFKSPFVQQFQAMRLNPCCVFHNDNSPSTVGGKRFSHKKAYSLRNHLSPKRLYLSAKKNILKRFFCVNTIFTWK